MSTPPKPKSTEQTTCAIVGGGPAGVILAYLLARNGVPVTLLEAHHDFDREFRGDTLHPSVMEILDELGLAEEVLQLPHTKLRELTFQTPTGPFTAVNFKYLKAKFPFIALVPQSDFLEFMVERCRGFPAFQLKLGCSMTELLQTDGRCLGIEYKDDRGDAHELRATLTVAADGRFSRVRKKAGLEQVKTSPPMDVLWFKLPRRPTDPLDFGARIAGGHLVVILARSDYFQLGYVIAKGGWQEVKQAGLPAFREDLKQRLPELADRVELIQDWGDVSVLSVESGMLKKWHQPGLLLIGDAAHVMSPVGGVGINYAIQDAVVAANVLVQPLRSGQLAETDLAKVQKQREFPTRLIQRFQGMIQKRVISQALDDSRPFRPPFFLRWPLFRGMLPWLLGLGYRRAHVAAALRAKASGE